MAKKPAQKKSSPSESAQKPRKVSKVTKIAAEKANGFRAPKYRSFNPALKTKALPSFKRAKPPTRDTSGLLSGRRILDQALEMLFNNKWLFLKVIAVHGLIYFLLIRAPESLSVEELRNLLNESNDEQVNIVKRTYDIATTVLGTKASEIRQPMLAVIVWVVASLAYIWTMREVNAHASSGDKQPILARQAYFSGMSGFVTVLCIIGFMVLQLVPFALGFWIYNIAESNAIFVNGIEQALFIGLWIALSLVSIYGLMRSALAMYFASIPGNFPFESEQMAGAVIRYRRIAVLRKMIFMLIVLLFMALAILISTIALAPRLAFISMDIILVASVPVYHLMFYHLYLNLVQDHSAD